VFRIVEEMQTVKQRHPCQYNY